MCAKTVCYTVAVGNAVGDPHFQGSQNTSQNRTTLPAVMRSAIRGRATFEDVVDQEHNIDDGDTSVAVQISRLPEGIGPRFPEGVGKIDDVLGVDHTVGIDIPALHLKHIQKDRYLCRFFSRVVVLNSELGFVLPLRECRGSNDQRSILTRACC